MCSEFNYNAPNFINFSDRDSEFDDEHVESYFAEENDDNDNVFDVDKFSSALPYNKPANNFHNLRKSVSMEDVLELYLSTKIENPQKNLKAKNDHKNKENQVPLKKIHTARSMETIDKLAQPKNRDQKYVSTAEAVLKFQKGTPVRFHTKRPKDVVYFPKSKLVSTIPQSPALKSHHRQRDTGNILSREEKERLDFEEQQKFKIKAHPVNQKVLHGPIKADVNILKKPNTVVEPFNITTMKKKEAPQTERKTEFHANPVPKCIYKSPKRERPAPAITKAMTPTFMKNMPKTLPKLQKAKSDQALAKSLQSTKPQPFSFEQKAEEAKQRKERLMQKVLEEEKKAREFHAKPAPKFCQKQSSMSAISSEGLEEEMKAREFNAKPAPKFCQKQSSMSASSLESQEEEKKAREFHAKPAPKFSRKQNSMSASSSEGHKSQEHLPIQFKARPPTVLRTEPFIPKKCERRVIEISNFQLNTVKRAKEREEFDIKIKERQEFIDKLKEEKDTQRRLDEVEEVMKIRRETTYKANPIRKYKEVKIVPSNKITIAVSPKFLSGKKNKENKAT